MRFMLPGLCFVVFLLSACGEDSGGGHNNGQQAGVGAMAGVMGGAGMTGGAGQGMVATVGPLPCDVNAIVVTECHLCHGPDGPKFGAPFNLVNTEDFHIMSASQPGKMVHVVANERINTAGMGQMPPIPAMMLAQPQLGTLSQWLTGGAAARPVGAACP